MKYCLMVSVMLMWCLATCAQEYRTPTFEKRPSWKESFSRRGTIDSNKWAYFTDYTNYNDVVFTNNIENTFVRNGKLHLVAKKDSENRKTSSSGRIHTLGKQSFLYGKLEVRAKIPTGNGVCPAIWMLREDHARTFPLGEIDIMEYIECLEKRCYYTTIHIVEKEPEEKEIRHIHSTKVDSDMTLFHTYTLEWMPDIFF